jgi:hypothetical protein
MSLHISSVLRASGRKLFSRTGAILLLAYMAFTGAVIPLSNTMMARIYEQGGFTEATGAIPLVLDLPLSVAVGGYFVGLLIGLYLSIVAIRTFVSGDGSSFPSGAFTRNVPFALVNVAVGGFVYFLLITVGFVLLFIPGLIAYVAFLFMMPYIVVEDRNFVDGLRSSYRLSKGNWLMLGVLLLVVIGFGAVIGFVGGLTSGLLLPPAFGQLLLVIIQAPVSLISLAVIAVAFNQLREDEPDSSDGPAPTGETSSTPA